MRKKRSDAKPEEERLAARRASSKKYRLLHPEKRRAIVRAYRESHRDELRAATNAARAKRREHVILAKAVPCADCHNRFPPECMDFDHRPGTTKHRRLSYKDNGYKRVPIAVGALPLPQFLEEIAKCDVVCANCHRIRTAARKRNAPK